MMGSTGIGNISTSNRISGEVSFPEIVKASKNTISFL